LQQQEATSYVVLSIRYRFSTQCYRVSHKYSSHNLTNQCCVYGTVYVDVCQMSDDEDVKY